VKLTFRQSGGFVGIDRGSEVETKSLPVNLRHVAESLVQDDAPMAAPNPAARDQMQYHLLIEGDGSRRDLHFDDETMPAGWNDLVAYLRGHSGPLPPQSAA
jgi:hypothetical protein